MAKKKSLPSTQKEIRALTPTVVEELESIGGVMNLRAQVRQWLITHYGEDAPSALIPKVRDVEGDYTILAVLLNAVVKTLPKRNGWSKGDRGMWMFSSSV